MINLKLHPHTPQPSSNPRQDKEHCRKQIPQKKNPKRENRKEDAANRAEDDKDAEQQTIRTSREMTIIFCSLFK